MKSHACNAIGCRALILPRELFCVRHLVMLQSDLRRILERHYREQQRQTKVFQRAMDQAREEILYAAMNGHLMPRPANFEWDESLEGSPNAIK